MKCVKMQLQELHLYLHTHTCVFTVVITAAAILCLSLWDPHFEDIIHKLDLIQKAVGRLVKTLKTMSAWKGDWREVMFVCVCVTSKAKLGTSQMVQWKRICLPMQGMWV